MRDRLCIFLYARTISHALVFIALLAGAGRATAQPSIRHDEVRCVPTDEFTQFVAEILPPDELRSVRLYFRSDLFPEYYFVDMSEAEARFSAVLPLPTDQTRRIVYYIEVVDQTFQISRSEEFVVGVEEENCDPGPGALLFAGSPGIVVGAVSGVASGIPAGFQAAGIVGFVSAAGAGGGGLGVAIGAAAGAAAGVDVLVTGGDDGGGSGSVPTVTTSTPGPTGPGPTGGGTTTTVPSSGTPSTTTTPQGPTTTTIGAATSSVPPPLSACFNWAQSGNCRVNFDSCSKPKPLIEAHEWRMLGPPVPATVPSPESNTEDFTFDFAGDPRCTGADDFNRPVRLTVTDSLGRSAQVQQNISVQPGSTLKTSTRRVVIRSNLAAQPPDGSVGGQVLVNGVALPLTSNQGPHELRAEIPSEEVVIEATLQTRAAPGTLWEFELASSSGSRYQDIQAMSGTAILVGNARIVFRLEGREGERVRFRARSR